MTRINVIPIQELSNVHLLAEHREIKRIPNVIASWKYNLEWQPTAYTLGTWHVKFFYDKLGFLYHRYVGLYNECIKRWLNVQNYSEAFKGCPAELFGGYISTPHARKINRIRINIRTTQSNLKLLKKQLWKQKNN